MNDLKYSVRGLLRTPAFSIVAVLTLAIGIGVTTAVFSLFDAVLLKSLPVKDPGQLFIVNAGHYPLYQALRAEQAVFDDVLASAPVANLDVVIDARQEEKAQVSMVSASYFSTFGVSASAGRVFSAIDDRPAGAPAIAVVSYGYWQRRLAQDPAVVGRVIRVSHVPVTIVGVAPAGFFGEEVGASPDLWVPLTMWAQMVPGRNLLHSPAASWLRIVGRLKESVSVSRAEEALTPVFRRVLEDAFGASMSNEDRREIDGAVLRLTAAGRGVSTLRGRFGRPLELLMAVVVLLLLISCANVANLSLARAVSRRRDVDLQLALGMSRGRLVRQVLTESLLLSVAGAAVGLVTAWPVREGLLRLISVDATRLPVAAQLDFRLLFFAAGLSVATAMLFGSVPAWRAAPASMMTSLASRHPGVDRRAHGLSSMLVVAQVAVSLVLLAGAGLFLRTLANLRDVDLGFAPERLMVLDVNPRAAGYSTGRAVAVTLRILDRLEAVPGVAAASFSENGVMDRRDSSTNLLRPEGLASATGGYPRAQWDVVGPGYFSTLEIALVAGRDIDERDDEGAPSVVAINEAMARRFFAGQNPIGRRLEWGDNKPVSFEVVAVVGDVKHGSPRDAAQLRFYLPYRQLSNTRPSWDLASVRFLVRTAADPAVIRPTLDRAIAAENPRLSAETVSMAPDLFERSLVQEKMIATLSAVFALAGVGLACVGLYGVIAYHVAQSRRDVGVRMALGAQRSQVLFAVLRRSLGWTALGVAMGIPLAMAVSRAAESLLFGLSATDTLTLAIAALVMVACGLAAAFIPARRAARVDPLVALKYE